MAPGELLRSLDDGETWTPLTGHGQFSMSGVEIVWDQEVYLSGNAGLMRSLDGGDTWENLQANLPPDEGLYFVRALEPVTALPGPPGKSRDVAAAGLYTSNDHGLYFTQAQDIMWDEALPVACRAVADRFMQLDTFVYWTETWAVTWDGRLMFTINHDWNAWSDVTAAIAPAEPIEVESGPFGRVHVLTREDGVFWSNGYDYPSDSPRPPRAWRYPLHPTPSTRGQWWPSTCRVPAR